ncbi:MAG: hydrolase, partial [Balneolaceae bacterium]
LNEEDFTVARVVHNVGQESRIGVIYTRRSSLGDEAPPVRQTVGVDLDLSTSRFLERKNLQFQVFFVAHSTNHPGEATSLADRSTRGFRVSYPNIPFYAHASYREFGTGYDPAVGFASRNGFRRFQPSAGYTLLTPGVSWLRAVNTELYFEYLMGMDFRPETVNVWLEPVNLTFETGASTELRLQRQYERIGFPFDIRRDGSIIIPAGEYRNSKVTYEVGSPPSRRIYLVAEAGYQGFWTGTRTDVAGSITVRPYPGINITGDWQRSMVDLAEGSFSTDLFRFRGNLDLTPTISFTSIVQYDNLSELVGFYQRMRWIIRPGADLFLVYSMNWLNEEERFRPLETSGGIKLTYTFRF